MGVDSSEELEKYPSGTTKWMAAIVCAVSFTCMTQQNVCHGKGHFDKCTTCNQTLSFQLVASCDVISCHIYIFVCEYISNIFEFESNLSFPPLAFQLTLRVHVGMEKNSLHIFS